jgi:hypothetical protein
VPGEGIGEEEGRRGKVGDEGRREEEGEDLEGLDLDPDLAISSIRSSPKGPRS